jgi:glycosyltransferase involved in cell wall biosynthesis
MLEALACGVPVVANLIEDVTDKWIKNDINGFVSETDSDIFAENIKKAALFSKEKMRKEAVKIMKAAGTDVIDAKYWELMNA